MNAELSSPQSSSPHTMLQFSNEEVTMPGYQDDDAGFYYDGDNEPDEVQDYGGEDDCAKTTYERTSLNRNVGRGMYGRNNGLGRSRLGERQRQNRLDFIGCNAGSSGTMSSMAAKRGLNFKPVSPSTADLALQTVGSKVKLSPLISTVETDKAKITNSPKAPIIPGIGLQNLGNTCYLSASLQTIFSLPQFIDKLYSTYSKLASPTKKMPLTQALLEVAAATGVLAEKDAPSIDSLVARSQIVSGISATSSLATANPVGLKRVMDVLTDKFAGYEQRDAHEFLSDLVDFLHDELAAPPSAIAAASTAGTLTAEGKSMDENKNPNPAKETVGKCEKEVPKNGAAAVPVQHASGVLPTDEYFHLNVRVCLKCDSCGYSRSKDEMYRHLSVDVGEDSNLEKWTVERSLKQFFQPEKREIKCEKCDSGKTATQTMAIISCPKALLLHFKRFIVTQEMKSSPIARPNSQGKENQAAPPPPRMEMVLHKNKAKIPIGESLSINSFIDGKKECPAGKYYLRGVVHHVGNTAFSGHYTTCAKRNLKECDGKADYISNSNTANKEQWVFFDDQVCTKKSTDYVTGCEKNQRNCYMALYELK